MKRQNNKSPEKSVKKHQESTVPLKEDTNTTQKYRRSSFALRGTRVSSVTGLADIPHEKVNPAEYFNHISPGIPEPLRLKTLLVWMLRKYPHACAEKLIEGLVGGEINVSWYHRPSSEIIVQTKENPINNELRKQMSIYQQRMEELREQISYWKELSINAQIMLNFEFQGKQQEGNEMEEMDLPTMPCTESIDTLMNEIDDLNKESTEWLDICHAKINEWMKVPQKIDTMDILKTLTLC